MKTINVLTEAFAIMYGGSERWLYSVSKRLMAKGFDLTVYTLDVKGCRNVSGNMKLVGLTPIPLYNFTSYVNRFFLVTLGFILNFKRLLECDYIFISQTFPLIFLPLLKLKRNLRAYAVFGNFYGISYSLEEKGLKGLVRALLEVFVCKVLGHFADKAFVVSAYIGRGLIGYGVPKEKVCVTYCGVNLEEILRISLDKTDEPSIIFVGRLVEQKRPWLLIDLVERLVSKGLKFKLFVIGDGYLKKRLIDDSKKRGLESYIAFLGRVSETEKFKLMKSSWTLVLPSGTEGLSITLIESMACCTPPVASKVGGVPELIDHEVNGFLFEANDFEAFCNYVEKLLTNKSLAELLGENGLKKVKNQFTWENVTERIIRVFHED